MKLLIVVLLSAVAHAEFEDNAYIQKELSEQKGHKLLWCVASGTNRQDVLNLLATSRDEETRLEVARNTNAPMKALRRLAVDPSEKIRSAVATQAFRLAEDIQWTLSNDRSRTVISDLSTQTTVPDIVEKIRAAYPDDGEMLWQLAVNRAHASNPTLEKIAHCRFANAAELAKQALEKRGPDFAQVYEEKVVGIKR